MGRRALLLILALVAIFALGQVSGEPIDKAQSGLDTPQNQGRNFEDFRVENPTRLAPADYFCDYIDYSVGTGYYYWYLPDFYGEDAYAMRFTPEPGYSCTLMTVYIGVDGGYIIGTPDMRVTVYDDNSGLPGTALYLIDVPNVFLPTGAEMVPIQFGGSGLVFEDTDYHIGVSAVGGAGDTLVILSDDGNYGSGRSTVHAGVWDDMLDHWGVDVNFFIASDLCCGSVDEPIIKISQVDFFFDQATELNSDWGLIQVDAARLLDSLGQSIAYLNAYGDSGWLIQNMIIDTADGIDFPAESFFDIHENTELPQLSLHFEAPPIPADFFGDGPREEFPLGDFEYNAEGAAKEKHTTTPGQPPQPAVFKPTGKTFKSVMKNLPGENVQAATNQCVPMSVANSLQFLENKYASIDVPHDHDAGIHGDNSLVGQLDSHMDRRKCTPLAGDGSCTCPDEPPTRTDGCGATVKEMMDGKFAYLKANGLEDKIVNKHQGYSADPNPATDPGGRIPAGDYYNADSSVSSKDESKNGKVTWEWIYEEIRNGEDVELIFSYEDEDGNWVGAHAVRVFGAGMTKGVPWLKYKHDALQTDQDPTDTKGLQEVEVKPIKDLDGDGVINFGSVDQEICFALSESPKDHTPRLKLLKPNLQLDGIPYGHNWGQVELTFVGDPDIMYFNLMVNGTWQVVNIPVLSIEGDTILQEMTYSFEYEPSDTTEEIPIEIVAMELTSIPLLVVPVDTQYAAVFEVDIVVNSGDKGKTIPPPELAKPADGGAAADPVKHSHKEFPNQDCGLNECVPVAVSNSLQFLNKKHSMGLNAADITTDKMKDATNWDADGAWIDHDNTRPAGQRNAWWEDKRDYMEKNKIPVTTRKITNLANLAAEIDAGQDVELTGDWHCAAIVGITDLGGGKFSIDVAHDTKQGEKGGTKTETITYNPTTKKFEGSPGFFDGSSFRYAVVECPKEEQIPGTNRHSDDGYIPPDGNPIGTVWHELWPTYCQYTQIMDWIDNGDGKLSFCDYIEIIDLETLESWWEHIEEVTTTIYVIDYYNPTLYYYLDYWYGNPDMDPIVPEMGDIWHEVWPVYSNQYYVIGWEDNGSEYLDSCDYLLLTGPSDIYVHVEEVATDIITIPADPPSTECDCVPGEMNDDGVINIFDVTGTIAYLYLDGAPPIPYLLCSGDMNGDCVVNIFDVTGTIAYLYLDGVPPVTCEEWLANCGPPLRK